MLYYLIILLKIVSSNKNNIKLQIRLRIWFGRSKIRRNSDFKSMEHFVCVQTQMGRVDSIKPWKTYRWKIKSKPNSYS